MAQCVCWQFVILNQNIPAAQILLLSGIFERLDIILKQSDGNRRDFSEESSEIAKFFIVGRPARLSGSRLPPGHRDKREGKRQWVTNSGGQSGWGGWVRR